MSSSSSSAHRDNTKPFWKSFSFNLRDLHHISPSSTPKPIQQQQQQQVGHQFSMNTDLHTNHSTQQHQQQQHRHHQDQQDSNNNVPPIALLFRQPSFADRLYLHGILYKPIDFVFIFGALFSCIYSALVLIFYEWPFIFWTNFTTSSHQHPISWSFGYSFCMAVSRASGVHVKTVAHLRWTSHMIASVIPFRMWFLKDLKIEKGIEFKIRLEELLIPERKALKEIRIQLNCGYDQDGKLKQNPLNPSQDYWDSFLPKNSKGYLANLPEESGLQLDPIDGTYTLRGDWIEALTPTHPKSPHHLSPKKLSSKVLLYIHGGGGCFCSPKFHRQMVSRMAIKFGPGTRAFVLDYRLAPEAVFPAAIHDVYAAYLYLTEPNHPAIIRSVGQDSEIEKRLPVDPKDIILCGDSAGANIAIGFSLYMRDYVAPFSPSTRGNNNNKDNNQFVPLTTILVSAWTDISSSLPSALSDHTYCYAPAPLGAPPFDRQAFDAFHLHNFASLYLVGDSNLIAHERNTLAPTVVNRQQQATTTVTEREQQQQQQKDDQATHFWNWYRSLALHPLVSPVFSANLQHLGPTLLQTGTFDRLSDETRLFAMKLGKANPGKNTVVRLENYRDMVHVHQYFEFLPLARLAQDQMVRFVERVDRLRELEQQENVNADVVDGSERSEDNNGLWAEFVLFELDGSVHEKDEGLPLSTLNDSWIK